MYELENKVLARELGKLGCFGAKWAAKRLPTETSHARFTLPLDLKTASELLRRTLHELGELTEEFAEQKKFQVSAIIGSGSMNLNPTIVHVEITAVNGTTEIHLEAVAKEGLIKQQSAAKAISRIQEQLRETVVFPVSM